MTVQEPSVIDRPGAPYDVLVVGAGMAGHCAALEAARLGARVLLLEKTALYGGSTRMCGGAFAFAGTAIQQEHGIADSPELLEQDLLAAGRHRNDRALVHVYAQRQHEHDRCGDGPALIKRRQAKKDHDHRQALEQGRLSAGRHFLIGDTGPFKAHAGWKLADKVRQFRHGRAGTDPGAGLALDFV